MVSDPSPELVFYLWLNACREVGMNPPSGTAHILADDQVCERIANHDLAIEGYTMPFYLVRDAFAGLPVKQVKGLVEYAKRIPEVVERDSYLRYKAGLRRAA